MYNSLVTVTRARSYIYSWGHHRFYGVHPAEAWGIFTSRSLRCCPVVPMQSGRRNLSNVKSFSSSATQRPSVPLGSSPTICWHFRMPKMSHLQAQKPINAHPRFSMAIHIYKLKIAMICSIDPPIFKHSPQFVCISKPPSVLLFPHSLSLSPPFVWFLVGVFLHVSRNSRWVQLYTYTVLIPS